MKTLLIVLLTATLGVALGIGTAVWRIRAAPWEPRLETDAVATVESIQPGTPAPKVVVDQPEYDFGTLDMTAEGSHEFVFRNEGRAPLTLSEGGTSCRCTMSKLDQASIPPGGSTKVTVTFKHADHPGPYQQTAKILTNDPQNPQVTLTIVGKIVVSTRIVPSELVFPRLSVGEGASAEAKVFCYLDEPFEITGRKWSEAASAEYFEATLRPLSAEELAAEEGARSGTAVMVNLRPGMAQGPWQQKLLLETNLPSAPTLTLPIQGNITSEITVVGRGWDADASLLTLGVLSGRTGAQRKVMLVVRGPYRAGVEFKLLRVQPSWLQVELGAANEINEGAVVQTPLTISVPPNSPPANHLGSEQGPLGEIELQTTHPQVPKLLIRVRFAVEN